MIRLIQRRLIVPRGDTGTFSIPVLAGKDTGDASVFTIFNPLTHRKIFEKVMQLSDGVLTMDLSHGDTVNLPVGQFVWDIKFYTNPTIADGHIVDGEEVDSYYAAFTLPVCEIRETGDNLLMSDEAPQATLSPGQVDYITASINEVTDSKNAAASSAAEADTSATNAETSASAAAVSEQAAQDSQEAALASQQAAQTAAQQAIASAAAAEASAERIEADLESKANIADLDDVAFSGDYNDLSNTPYIPSIEGLATVQYVDEKTEKVIAHFPVHSEEELTQNLTCSHTIAELYEAYSAGKTIMGSLDFIGLETQSILMESSITFGSRPIIKFKTDMVGDADAQLVIVGGYSNNQDVWHLVQQVGLTAYKTNLMDLSLLRFTALGGIIADVGAPVNNTDVANKQYVDNAIPTNVSQLANDAGYLTEHQDISGKANSADLATVATSGSYNDLLNKPEGLATTNYVDDKTAPVIVNLTMDNHQNITSDMSIAALIEANQNNKNIIGQLVIELEDMAMSEIISLRCDYMKFNDQYVFMFSNEVGVEGLTTILISGTSYNNQESWRLMTALPLACYADGFNMQTLSDFNAMSKKITRLADPTENQDAANKKYVDNKVAAFTETDPTIPAWAKASTKPTYTAAEVGAPTVQEMNSAISTAIGNINSFDMAVVQALPTQDISTHTIYLVPKTGETNDVYDEYIYINNAWEMIGNTQIDLSNYVQKTDYATNESAGVVKVNGNGVAMTTGGTIQIIPAPSVYIKAGTEQYTPIAPKRQHEATFYGLAKAAGDTTQSVSTNAVGTYTADAKAAIQAMLGVPATSTLDSYALKTNTILETTLSMGRKTNTTIGQFSTALGIQPTASGQASTALGIQTTASGVASYAAGISTTASNQASHAEGISTIASGSGAHAEGGTTTASGAYSHAEGENTTASGNSSHTEGWNTIANHYCQHVFGQANVADISNAAASARGTYVEIIGNGTTVNSRSNAYALDWDGNGHYMGSIYVGANADSTGGTKVLCEADFATDTEIQNIINGGAGA